MPDVGVLDEHEGSVDSAMWICRFARGDPGRWGRHYHRQHQIAWVSQGVSTVLFDDGQPWVVTPARAMWIPSGRPHDIANRDDAVLHCLYVWPEQCPLDWSEPVELPVTPLARELLLWPGEANVETPVSSAVATVLFAQFGRAAPAGPSLPMPHDQRAAEVARALLDHPAGQETVEEWADRVTTSASTLRRAFLAETGMTFSEWRTRARLDAALPLLAGSLGVGRVAHRVGYASRSGFVDAFRRHFGHPPATYRPTHYPGPT